MWAVRFVGDVLHVHDDPAIWPEPKPLKQDNWPWIIRDPDVLDLACRKRDARDEEEERAEGSEIGRFSELGEGKHRTSRHSNNSGNRVYGPIVRNLMLGSKFDPGFSSGDFIFAFDRFSR